MKHNKKIPCKECPFRKTSTKGWLGDMSLGPQEFLQQFMMEVERGCHMDPDEQCIGGIIMANKSCKLYRNPTLYAHQRRAKNLKSVMDATEFIKHHTI